MYVSCASSRAPLQQISQIFANSGSLDFKVRNFFKRVCAEVCDHRFQA